MGLLPDRLKFSFRRSSAPPPPSPAVNPTDPPPEFLCPISGELMADPVIISSGETFDRICLESLQNLSFNSSSSSSSSLLLIPNSALRATIVRWCDNSGVAHPITLSSEIAICYARRLLSSSSSSKSVLLSPNTKLLTNCSTKVPSEDRSSMTYSCSYSSDHSSSSSCSTEIMARKTQKAILLSSNTEPLTNCSTKLPNENSSSMTYSSSSSSDHSTSSSSSTEINPPKPQKSVLLSSDTKSLPSCSTKLPKENSSTVTYSSSSDHSSSSSSSTEIISDPLENNILQKLRHAHIQEQEKALISLLEATRESTSRRIALCSSNILTALRRLLLSRHPFLQSTSLAIIVNLSLEPSNKIPIVRSGATPSIINLLQSSSNATNEATKTGDPNLLITENAAAALFSLSLEEQNRTAIGVLGAIPPLLSIFCNSKEDSKARMEAGMALHYLVLSEMNMTKLARIAGAVKGLIAVVIGEEKERDLRKLAMRFMVGMVGCNEGKKAFLDVGAIEAMVKMLSKDEEEDEEEEKEMVIMILYGISMSGLRFRGIARRVGMEEVLERVVERLEGEKKEMVRMIIRVLSGEEENGRDFGRILLEEDEPGSAARRRMNRDSGDGSCPGSDGF